MDLLAFFDECVVLRDTTESELVHKVDFKGVGQVLVGEILDGDGESRTKQHDLTILGMEVEKLFDDRCEFRGEELVGFVHDEGWTFA